MPGGKPKSETSCRALARPYAIEHSKQWKNKTVAALWLNEHWQTAGFPRQFPATTLMNVMAGIHFGTKKIKVPNEQREKSPAVILGRTHKLKAIVGMQLIWTCPTGWCGNVNVITADHAGRNCRCPMCGEEYPLNCTQLRPKLETILEELP